MPSRSLSIANRHPRLRFNRRELAAALAFLDAKAGKFQGGSPPGELSVVFLTDTALARLHAEFLADPAPTDVITFAGDQAQGLGGEICVSADAARRQAAARSQKAFSAELTLYVVHGWLHLAGYDDHRPAQKRVMRRAEARALGLWRVAGFRPGFRLVGRGTA
ncbi:MAG: rRNA maturation RNase YbeY [Opitutaceae bacterium]|nr:rRNA maturation RNase YbeY [Opitutaceae bacterium]